MSSAIRKNTKITVYKATDCCGLPSGAGRFMEFWQSKLDEIPAEFSDSATIELYPREVYGESTYMYIKISYYRPESDAEIEAREAGEKKEAARRRELELEQYNKLKSSLGL